MKTSKETMYQIQLKSIQRKMSAIEQKHLSKKETLSRLVYMYDKHIDELAVDIKNLK